MSVGENVLIPSDQNMSQGTKCFNTPKAKYVAGGKMFQYPQSKTCPRGSKYFNTPTPKYVTKGQNVSIPPYCTPLLGLF